MEDFVEGLIEKCGLSKEQAEKVVDYVQDNAPKVMEWLQSSGAAEKLKDALPGGLGKLF